MRVVLTYNLKTANVEAEQEFDAPHHVAALVKAIRSLGHVVTVIDVTSPVARWFPRLLKAKPHLVFNIAEGARGRAREAVVPTLLDAYGIPYTGSDAWTLTTTLDKHLTSLFLRARNIPDVYYPTEWLHGDVVDVMPAKIINKPNYEGSSKGIVRAAVGTFRGTQAYRRRLARKYPDGVLVQEFVAGRDLTVSWLAGRVLPPLTIRTTTTRTTSKDNVYDYRQKGLFVDEVTHQHVADVDAVVVPAVAQIVACLRIRDFARIDFRLDHAGRLWFLEVNALPSLEYDGAFANSAEIVGMSYPEVVRTIIDTARRRQ